MERKELAARSTGTKSAPQVVGTYDTSAGYEDVSQALGPSCGARSWAGRVRPAPKLSHHMASLRRVLWPRSSTPLTPRPRSGRQGAGHMPQGARRREGATPTRLPAAPARAPSRGGLAVRRRLMPGWRGRPRSRRWLPRCSCPPLLHPPRSLRRCRCAYDPLNGGEGRRLGGDEARRGQAGELDDVPGRSSNISMR